MPPEITAVMARSSDAAMARVANEIAGQQGGWVLVSGGAVRARVRPILMTAITSSFGMLPLVLFPGAGSELYRGLGGVVVGGLIVSTVFTLFLIPALLSIVFTFHRPRQDSGGRPGNGGGADRSGEVTA